jgi:hypothetical protein
MGLCMVLEMGMGLEMDTQMWTHRRYYHKHDSYPPRHLIATIIVNTRSHGHSCLDPGDDEYLSRLYLRLGGLCLGCAGVRGRGLVGGEKG